MRIQLSFPRPGRPRHEACSLSTAACGTVRSSGRYGPARVLLALLLAVLGGCNLQKNMLYYPDHSLPSPQQLAADRIRFWPSESAQDYRGFIGPTPAGKARGTIVVFHGNAGTAAHRAFYTEALVPLGFRVVLAEYPGYGGRPGELGEESLVRDGRETVRLASEQFGSPLYVLGESLGCGVAAAIAKDPSSRIDGIILITPWDSLLSIAKDKFPWLPVRLLLSDSYDSVANLKAFGQRIAVVAAEQDEVIPPAHARKLYQSVQSEKQLWTIRGAGHNDWPGRVDQSWWREIMDYVAKASR